MNDEQQRKRRQAEQEWHCAINTFSTDRPTEHEWPRWLYEAKTASMEVERLEFLHARERMGKLPVVHQQCSRQAPEQLTENFLTCCLGVECRKCPELAAIGTAKMPPEEIDRAKAWTCVGHILSKGGDPSGEGFITDESDRIFWERTYASMAADPEDMVP